MTDFSSVTRPSSNLSRVFRTGGAKSSIVGLESNVTSNIEAIKAKVRGRQKLTPEEIQILNGQNRRAITKAFDEAKESCIEQSEIKMGDDSEVVSVKLGIVEEVTDFVRELATFIIDTIKEIVSAIWNTIVEIGRKVKSVFTALWSWL